MYLRSYYVPMLRKHRKLWGPGPWAREPDHGEFWHAGMRCEVTRSQLGNWCGYVLVPEGHPWNGVYYGAIDCDVHGGLTYSEMPSNGPYRVGFDCAHLYDLIPFGANGCSLLGAGFSRRMKRIGNWHGGEYRTMQWVIAEAKRLAEQAREAAC